MDAVLEFDVQRFHHCAVLRNSAHPVKMTGRDSDTKMGFTTLPPPGVTPMLVRFIEHLEESGGKSVGKLGNKGVFDAHLGGLSIRFGT